MTEEAKEGDELRPYEQHLPLRENAPVCDFYLKAGWCRYASKCRYSHPPEIMDQHRPKSYNSLGFPLRENVGDCHYFLQSRGRCKFGSTCKYNHPQEVIDHPWALPRSPQQQQLCSHLYYTGVCPFGDACLFVHQVVRWE